MKYVNNVLERDSVDTRRPESELGLITRGATARLLVLSVRNFSSSPEAKLELRILFDLFISSGD